MGRPRNFDADEVLERAVELFRSRGWRNTSVDDLVLELGVPRQSLYNAFGDKDDLYAAALERYRIRQCEALSKTLEDPRPVKAVLRDLFAATVDRILEAPESWNCLVVNAALERGDDSRCSNEVARSREAMENALARRLSAAQAAGEIGRGQKPMALARFILNAQMGLPVMGRGRPDRRVLEDAVHVTLSALG